MNRTHHKIVVAAILAISTSVLGVVAARLFFGLSHQRMLIGLTIGFAALMGLGLLANRLTYGVWIKRPTEQQRAVLDARLKRTQLGYLLGSLALLPIVFLMVNMGVDSSSAMNLSILAGAIVATILLVRRLRQTS